MNQRDASNLDYGIGMSVKALITAMGMQAENDGRKSRGESMAYTEKDFQAVIEECGVHHNAIVSRWSY